MLASCQEEGRIDQDDPSDYVPEQVSVTSVRPTPGGAVIRYNLPDDDNLRYVKVVYERNGETCENSSSRYVDSLVVEGFGDALEREARIYSVGYNDRLSEPIEIKINPLTPIVRSISLSLDAVFGGVSVDMKGNSDNSQLAIVLIRDVNLEDDGKDASEIDWSELYTFHVTGQDVSMKRRDLECEPALFGAYVRDRWGNCSDTLYTMLTPMEEQELDKSTWKRAGFSNDDYSCYGLYDTMYGFEHLWNGATDRTSGSFFTVTGGRERIFTIDMGYEAKFSRMRIYPREGDANTSWLPWHWQIYGCQNPSRSGDMDEWFLLGDFTQYKPSGMAEDGTPGTWTTEDVYYLLNTNDFDFVSSEAVPDPQRPTRYIRFRLIDNLKSAFMEYDSEPTDLYYGFGEVTFWGVENK